MTELSDLPDKLLVKLVGFMKLVFNIKVFMNLHIKFSLELGLLGKFDVEILSEHVNFILEHLHLLGES